MALGTPETGAHFMATLETMTVAEMKERRKDAVKKVIRRPPQAFDAIVEENESA
jgi:hypothetical protein